MGCCDGSEAMPDIKPLHPAILVNALQGNIHRELGRSRAAKSIKIRKNMMIKNLLKTWQILAPNEVKYVNDTLYLLNSIEEGIACIGQGLLPHEQDALQGYIQRGIQDRGWWWKCSKQVMYSATIFLIEEEDMVKHGAESSLVETLLTAYLTALAAQRPITQGQWQHFKGDVVKVKSTATWTTHKIHSDFLGNSAAIEELPDEKIQVHLSIDDADYQRWGYRASKDYGERVIYIERNGKRWARKTEDFLGLVDAKHPEHEGLLRFMEVAK
jgi:hypothetical protein